MFTSTIKNIEAIPNEEIRVSPSIFQRALIPKVDYRVTIVGEQLFAARVERLDQKSLKTDWRMEEHDLRFVQCSLPSDVENLCHRFVRECALLFGAMDLVEHKGRFFFLEINPNGEWGWLQKPHDIPIAKALCDLLISYDKRDPI